VDQPAQTQAPANQPAPVADDDNPDNFEVAHEVASGQAPPYCIAEAIKLRDQAKADGKPFEMGALLHPGQEPVCATWLLLRSRKFSEYREKAVHAALSQAESAALAQLKTFAQQEGSSSGTGGSTSLTAKGLSSKVLSIATEYGALTQSTNQQTTTASGTFAGVPVALAEKGFVSDCYTRILKTPCVNNGWLNFLSSVSYSLSFPSGSTSSTTVATPSGPNSGTAQQVTTTSSDHSVSQVTVKWIAIPAKLDEGSAQKARDAIAANAALKQLLDAQALLTRLIGYRPKGADGKRVAVPPMVTYLNQQGVALYTASQQDATGQVMITAWEGMADSLMDTLQSIAATDPGVPQPDEILAASTSLASSYSAAVLGEQQATLTQQMALPPTLSFEYDLNRPTGQPSNSVVRGIYQKTFRPKDPKANPLLVLTANGAISWYNSNQSDVPGAQTLRDVQLAAELGHDFSVNSSVLGQLNFTLSTAGYFQYQNSPAILNVTPGTPVDGVTFVGLPTTATKAFADKGNLGLWQMKVTTGSGTAVKVPLSVTWASRTELITTPTWKAQIGVSYDFDSLFSK
jgi:hypothetical protein